ncbi:MAG TPA: hypothetical protein VM734_33775 [Kofleriaceae bacterium]|nr:hypothetical protein [Kofleriaceae bacterium]
MRSALVLLLLAAAACTAGHQYGYAPAGGGPEQRLAPVQAEVVTADRAARAGLPGELRSFGFGDGADGTQLVADFLARADAEEAVMVSELAIYLRSVHDGQAVECRTEIVPETVTTSHWRPSRTETVSVMRPVTRTVTDYEQACSTTTRSESRMVTEYQQRCRMVSKPVTRTRTTYSSSYDYSSRSYRSMPRTETYTAYESQQECRSEPVTRYRTEQVPHRECHQRPVTRTVTRYEFQLESRFVPARVETLRRQRLRELEPVCYAAEGTAAPGGGGGNRIEGRVHRKR